MSDPYRRQKWVLVVDDDAGVRALLDAFLGQLGHAVLPARDGAHALRLLASAVPNAILLDMVMPVMDGPGFRREQLARGLAVDVPLVLMSARAIRPDEAARMGAAHRLAKPFDFDHVRRVLRDVLGDEPGSGSG